MNQLTSTFSARDLAANEQARSFTPERRAQIAQLKALLYAKRDCTAAHHVLYNLLRGLDPRRGFTAPRNRGAGTNFAFRDAALRAEGIAKQLGFDWEPQWAASLKAARRQAYLEDFAASCEPGQAPSVSGALWAAMRLTPHGEKSDVLAHGKDCWARYYGLTRALARKEAYSGADPQWLTQFGEQLLAHQQPGYDMAEYLVNHDCGKAATYCVDEQGRAHFPGHAEKSAQMWRQAGRSEVQARLMELDMALHTMPVSEMAEFAKNPLAPSLLLATYAQLHSNAQSVFGGLESDSFKMKLKALNRRAKALIEAWGWGEQA